MSKSCDPGDLEDAFTDSTNGFNIVWKSLVHKWSAQDYAQTNVEHDQITYLSIDPNKCTVHSTFYY